MPCTAVVDLRELLDHLFLVRDGDAQAADAQRPGLVDEAAQVLARHAEGHIDLVQPEVGESGVMDQGAEAMPDRIGHDAVDLGIGVDLVVAVDLGHVLEAELARRQGPFAMEGGIGVRGPELAGQDAGRHADIAHPQADRGDLGLADHVQDPHVIAGMVGHGRDLDDVRHRTAKGGGGFRPGCRASCGSRGN